MSRRDAQFSYDRAGPWFGCVIRPTTDSNQRHAAGFKAHTSREKHFRSSGLCQALCNWPSMKKLEPLRAAGVRRGKAWGCGGKRHHVGQVVESETIRMANGIRLAKLIWTDGDPVQDRIGGSRSPGEQPPFTRGTSLDTVCRSQDGKRRYRWEVSPRNALRLRRNLAGPDSDGRVARLAPSADLKPAPASWPR